MKLDRTTTALTLMCVISLAGCSQGEQKTESTASQGNNASSANTESAPKTDSTTATTTTTTTATTTGQSTGGEVYLGTINGVISDSMCGKDHKGMGELGKDPVACTKKCIKSGAKYVLVDSKGDVYALSNQEKPADFAGAQVAITGHIDPTEKSIHVHSLAPQK